MTARGYVFLVFLLLRLVVCLACPGEEDCYHEVLVLHRGSEIEDQGFLPPAEGTRIVDTPEDDPKRDLTGGTPRPSEVSALTSLSAAALTPATPPEAATSGASHVAENTTKGMADSYEQTHAFIKLASEVSKSTPISTVSGDPVAPTPDAPVAQEIECFRKCPKMEGHLPVCATNGLTYPNLASFLCVKRCHLPDVNLAHFLGCDSGSPKKTTVSKGESFWRRRRGHQHRHYALDADRLLSGEDDEGVYEEDLPGHPRSSFLFGTWEQKNIITGETAVQS